MKDPDAVELGRRGGIKGGPARAASLTPAQRSEAARKAAQARWGPPVALGEPDPHDEFLDSVRAAERLLGRAPTMVEMSRLSRERADVLHPSWAWGRGLSFADLVREALR